MTDFALKTFRCLKPIYALTAAENHSSQLAGITAGILCDFLFRRDKDKNTRIRQWNWR